MRVYLTRHTRTNFNDMGLCNADPAKDVHLTELGIIQARELAQKLKDVDFQQIYISNLPRTMQTAEFINVYHNVPIVTDERLRDNGTGYESLPADDYYAALMSATDPWQFRGPGKDAETLIEFRARIKSFLDELRSETFNSVLIVTHMCTWQHIIGLQDDLSLEACNSIEAEQGSFTTFEL